VAHQNDAQFQANRSLSWVDLESRRKVLALVTKIAIGTRIAQTARGIDGVLSAASRLGMGRVEDMDKGWGNMDT